MKFRGNAVSGAGALLVIALVIALICLGPWLFMWSVGVLFGGEIIFGFKTWLAALVLCGLLRGGSSSN